MPTKDSSVKGIRLLNDEWKVVDEIAGTLGMSRNEYCTRILRGALRVRNTDEIVEDTDDDERGIFDD